MSSTIQIEVTRADRLESCHRVHAVAWKAGSGIEAAWGEIDRAVYPRSSSKMIQALPLIESGAGAHLSTEQLALACASHQGAAIHTDRVRRWLADLELSESDLRCGAHVPNDPEASSGLIRDGAQPDQCHNNCSGKHTGFLTLTKHLGAGPEYIDPDHPVQQAVRQAWEEVTEEPVQGHGFDGCSAPNFVSSLQGVARGMATFAAAASGGSSDLRSAAQRSLVDAMIAHPDLVAGSGRACTELMQAMDGRAAIKTGAEGFFVAIVPGQGLGIALKAECGTTRAAEAAMAALLSRYGVLAPDHPAALARNGRVLRNHAGRAVGGITARLS